MSRGNVWRVGWEAVVCADGLAPGAGGLAGIDPRTNALDDICQAFQSLRPSRAVVTVDLVEDSLTAFGLSLADEAELPKRESFHNWLLRFQTVDQTAIGVFGFTRKGLATLQRLLSNKHRKEEIGALPTQDQERARKPSTKDQE